MDFIDLCGASGATYRFRPWPSSGVHPPIAGNFALVDPSNGKLIALGTLEDLSLAAVVVARRVRAGELFTRLNIARRGRETEHADLAERYPDVAAAGSQ
jgi:hypothetical protein